MLSCNLKVCQYLVFFTSRVSKLKSNEYLYVLNTGFVAVLIKKIHRNARGFQTDRE